MYACGHPSHWLPITTELSISSRVKRTHLSSAFGMGMNLCNIMDSINLGLPTTYAGLIQQNGHTGQNEEMEACGWTYIESVVCTAIMEDESLSGEAGLTGNKCIDKMDANLYQMVRAHVHGICLIATSNACSGNPGEDSLLTCAQAKQCLFCSSCQPYPLSNIPSSDPVLPNSVPFIFTALILKVSHLPLIWQKRFEQIFQSGLKVLLLKVGTQRSTCMCWFSPFQCFGMESCKIMSSTTFIC